VERIDGSRRFEPMTHGTASQGLRIAMMLESDGPGGAEMMVFRLSEELRRLGHTIVPVGPRTGIGWLGDLYKNAGFTSEVFWLDRPIDPPGVRRFMEMFRRQRIDVVHSHEFTMAVYGSTAARLLSIPHLMTMHGGLTVTKALRRRVALRWAMRRSRFAVAVSGATRDQFARDLGVRPNRFTVVHNGVPVIRGDATRVRAEFGVTPTDTVILAVGTLEKNKNHRGLIEALSRLQQGGLTVPWKLVIAGGRGGDQHQPLLELVRALGLEGRVHIVTNRNDIADLQALAQIFVMPSLWEGLPMAMLEAMVAGNAVIASATGGIPEAVSDGADGILVPPGDVDALARNLRALLENTNRREQLAAAARARAHGEFTVEVMARRYLDLYQTMMTGR
jgi:glycosyltransferase involved in cell wall biosynthesis